MSKSHTTTPMPGQDALFGVEEVTPRRIITDTERAAFGAVPNLLGGHMEFVLPTTSEDRARVGVDYLNLSLYGEGDHSVDGIWLNSAEYIQIARNINSLLGAVGTRTALAREGGNEARKYEAEIQSRLSTARSKLERHQTITANYEKEISSLNELLGYIGQPGRALATKDRLLTLAAAAWTGNFDNILGVAADKNGWNPDEKQTASQAMIERLFSGPQSERMAYWGSMTRLAIDYNRNKRLLFMQRKRGLEGAIDRLQADLSHLHDTAGINPL